MTTSLYAAWLAGRKRLDCFLCAPVDIAAVLRANVNHAISLEFARRIRDARPVKPLTR